MHACLFADYIATGRLSLLSVDILVTPTKTIDVDAKAVAASRIRWPACSLSKVPPTAVLLKSKGPS